MGGSRVASRPRRPSSSAGQVSRWCRTRWGMPVSRRQRSTSASRARRWTGSCNRTHCSPSASTPMSQLCDEVADRGTDRANCRASTYKSAASFAGTIIRVAASAPASATENPARSTPHPFNDIRSVWSGTKASRDREETGCPAAMRLRATRSSWRLRSGVGRLGFSRRTRWTWRRRCSSCSRPCGVPEVSTRG